jgi:glutathione S-transferase
MTTGGIFNTVPPVEMTVRDPGMLTLYDFGNSVCCQKVRITLVEKGLEWKAIRVDLFKSEQYDPKYLKMNPKGVVPTLVHNGTPVIESTLICEYIDDTFPDPPLIPKDPAERAQMRLWSKFVDEGLFDGVTELSFSAMFRERMRAMTPTLADINMMPFVARLSYLGLLEAWTADRPHINEWWARAQQWPSFKRGLSDLITEHEFTEMRTHGPKIRADVDKLVAGLRNKAAA